MDNNTQDKGQYKSVQQTSLTKEIKADFLNKDHNFVFVFKKTEKIVAAIYLVTNLFSDHEPIKWTLRKKSGDALSFIVDHEYVDHSNYTYFSFGLKKSLLELVSLLEICHRSGLVSPMNFSILKHELVELAHFVERWEHTKTEDRTEVSLAGVFDDVHTAPSTPTSFVPKKETSHTPVAVSKQTYVQDKTKRQEMIIELIRKHKELTIKDISGVIKDCSEKTIQRELIYLIEKGVLKKTGERRWSKYSIVQ